MNPFVGYQVVEYRLYLYILILGPRISVYILSSKKIFFVFN
jgi:hypothetical protein